MPLFSMHRHVSYACYVSYSSSVTPPVTRKTPPRSGLPRNSRPISGRNGSLTRLGVGAQDLGAGRWALGVVEF